TGGARGVGEDAGLGAPRARVGAARPPRPGRRGRELVRDPPRALDRRADAPRVGSGPRRLLGGGRRQLRHLRDPLTPQTPKKAPHRNRCGASTRLMLRGSPPATRAPDQQFAPAHTGPLTPFPPPTPTGATVAAAADATSGRAAWCRATGPRPGR